MGLTLCDNIELNRERCTCTKESCKNKGMCCECVRHHRKLGNLPMCLRDLGSDK